MTRTVKNEKVMTPEEKLVQALVPEMERPYRVPDNWCWTKLKTITVILNGFAFKSANYVDTGIRIIRIANVQDGFVEDDAPVYYPLESEKEIERFLLHADDLLISLTGNVGRVAMLPPSFLPAALNQRVGCLRMVSDKILKKYLFFSLLRDSFQKECIKNSKGSAQLNMSTEWLKEQAFPLAPFAEQQRIVDRIERLFAKLDEAKEKAQAVVDGFEDRKSTILHNAFSGDLTENWRKKNGLSRADWAPVLLADICKINPSKANTKDLPDDLEVSFFPMPALSEIYGAITEPQTRKLGEVRTGFTNFSEGDVVFAKITPCMENGKSAVIGPLVNNIGFGTTEFFVLRCGEKLYNRFLWHLIRDRSFRSKAKAVMSGAVGQQRVPKSFLENYPLSLPSVEEQIEIVHILDGLFSKEQQAKEIAEQLIEQIDVIKKSILARAFRGELGTNDPNDESAVELLKRVLV